MSKRKWFWVALVAAGVFLLTAYSLIAENKPEVVTLLISGAVAVLAANASGKADIKELKFPDKR